jgi:hypothetical protein
MLCRVDLKAPFAAGVSLPPAGAPLAPYPELASKCAGVEHIP